MNWIKKIANYFNPPKELTLDEIRVISLKYTENPFTTNMRNYSQRVKIEESPTGWGIILLKEDEVKKRLDKGICWLDYPVLDEAGKEIEGLTGINFC